MLLLFDDLQQKVLQVLLAMKIPIIIQKQVFAVHGFSKPDVCDTTIHTSRIRKHCVETYRVSTIMQSRSSFAYNCCTSNSFSHNPKCKFSYSITMKTKHLRGFLSNLNFSFLLSNGGSISLKKNYILSIYSPNKIKILFLALQRAYYCRLVFYMSALSHVWINTPGISLY